MLSDLLRQHGPVAPGQSLDLLAFSGSKTTPVAQLRERGMRRALAEHPEVRLRQLVYGEWSRQRAFEQATLLFKRYPQTALVWSANDQMALGAMQALQASGGMPGKDALFSAVNSSPEILQARLEGQVSSLVAGHFTVGGWAMVLINDDAKGVDIGAYGGRDRQLALFQLIDAGQARRLLGPTPSVNFRALSAQGKPTSYRYPFSLQLCKHRREQDAQDHKVTGLAVGKVTGAILSALYAECCGHHAMQHLPERWWLVG
jgi:hypothetical protein